MISERERFTFFIIITLVSAASLGIIWFALWLVFAHPFTGVVHAQELVAADYSQKGVMILPPLDMSIEDAVRKDVLQISEQRQYLPQVRVEVLPGENEIPPTPEKTASQTTLPGIMATDTPWLTVPLSLTHTTQIEENITPSGTPDVSISLTPSPSPINTGILTYTPIWTNYPPINTPNPGTNPTNIPATGQSPTDTSIPPTNTPKPPTNTPKPPTNTPKPPTDTPKPPTKTPVPPPPTDPYPYP